MLCFLDQKWQKRAEGWGWGGGPKRYVFHSKSTCGHFVTFGPKSHAKTTVFYTTFRHGAVWWLLVQKVMLQPLCFPVSNRLCQKVEFSFFAKSIWDRKCKDRDNIFLTENHKMITCWKVLHTPRKSIGFSDPKWQNGHMLIWDRKNNALDDAFLARNW